MFPVLHGRGVSVNSLGNKGLKKSIFGRVEGARYLLRSCRLRNPLFTAAEASATELTDYRLVPVITIAAPVAREAGYFLHCRVSLLSICRAVTVAPTTAPPVESRTTPEIDPEIPCANTRPLANAITPSATKNLANVRLTMLIPLLSHVFFGIMLDAS
jgi:hypothetical protein